MQFKSLLFLVSSAAVIVSASTLSQVVGEITQLEARVNDFDGLATTPIPPTGETEAKELNRSIVKVINSLNAIAVLTEDLNPVPANACDAIVAAGAPTVAPFDAGIQGLVDQEVVLKSLLDGRILKNLFKLRRGGIRTRNAMVQQLPASDCLNQYIILAGQTIDTIDDAIIAYNN